MQPAVEASTLDHLLRELSPVRHRPARFLFAILLAGAALPIAALLDLVFEAGPAAVFAFFVALSTGVFGVLAGLCTVGVSALAVDYFYLPPVFRLNLDSTTLRVALGFAAIAGVAHITERYITRAIRRRVKPPLGLQGSFDGVEDGEAYGWALNADAAEEPVLVTAFINGKPVAQVAAVHYRPDIAEKKNAGSHGFYIDLRARAIPDTETVIDIRFPNGALLPNGPKRVRLPRMELEEAGSAVLFMHIPKTAGTALREALAGNFRQSQLVYLYPDPPGFLVRDLRSLPLEQLRMIRLVIGHFQFGMHEWLPQPFEYITIVREPVARVFSQYCYWYEKQAAGQGCSLEELFTKRLKVDFDNFMVRCFAGTDERAHGPGQLTEKEYARAVVNMRTAFAFIGHREYLSESYAWLARRYGWKTIKQLPSVNVTQIKRVQPLNAELIRLIRHYNYWDCLLYDEICRRFPPPTSIERK